MNHWPWLSFLIGLPFLGGLGLLGLKEDGTSRSRHLALGVSVLTLLIGLGLGWAFDPEVGGMQWTERLRWIPWLQVDYHLGLDGLSLAMVLLTAAVVPMALAASGGIRSPRYHGLVLLLEAGLMGTFLALNFFPWFLFWEMSLIPVFFLMRFWGRLDAGDQALRFFMVTMAGSIAMLTAFMALFWVAGTMDFLDLAELRRSGRLAELMNERLPFLVNRGGIHWIFGGIFLGLAVKVPLFPVHSWQPSTYRVAPFPVTMIMSGLMSKMGLYGLLRIGLPIFPESFRAGETVLVGMALATILYSALAALGQRNLRRILAYSSMNHLGYCFLGIWVVAKAGTGTAASGAAGTAALHGVLIQMVSHGFAVATLFCLVGFLESRRGGQAERGGPGGLRYGAPVFSALMGTALLASLGLPGFGGFIGEILIFKGTLAVRPALAIWAIPGLLVTAIFLLRVWQEVFHGPAPEPEDTVPDLSWAERGVVLPALLVMGLLGVWPGWLLHPLNATVRALIDRL